MNDRPTDRPTDRTESIGDSEVVVGGRRHGRHRVWLPQPPPPWSLILEHLTAADWRGSGGEARTDARLVPAGRCPVVTLLNSIPFPPPLSFFAHEPIKP
ncbi:unnamed protein product [Soboliphyme baturini]|uniref:Uncharacterized protein n=1 Tax=Soboliphyme baturini TaxID=241478 RepID=A0A183IPA7_9BILA|nr:unnamed protein product [Soboliphyme baturini]